MSITILSIPRTLCICVRLSITIQSSRTITTSSTTASALATTYRIILVSGDNYTRAYCHFQSVNSAVLNRIKFPPVIFWTLVPWINLIWIYIRIIIYTSLNWIFAVISYNWNICRTTTIIWRKIWLHLCIIVRQSSIIINPRAARTPNIPRKMMFIGIVLKNRPTTCRRCNSTALYCILWICSPGPYSSAGITWVVSCLENNH